MVAWTSLSCAAADTSPLPGFLLPRSPSSLAPPEPGAPADARIAGFSSAGRAVVACESRHTKKAERIAPRLKWWRCRDSHPGPSTACRNRYRLIPGFVSPALNPGLQGTGQLRIVLSLRGTKRAPGGSSLNLTQYSPLRRAGCKRGTLRRAPRPARWSWLLFF